MSILKITPPQSPPALTEESFESASSASQAGATKIGSLFSSKNAPTTRALPMKPSPRASVQEPQAGAAKLSIRVSVPRSRSPSSPGSIRSSAATTPNAVSPQYEKWQDAQSVNWKPVQTRRGSAPRAYPGSRKPSQLSSPKTPASSTPKVSRSGDFLSTYSRGTNGPARPEGNDPRQGRGAFLSRSNTSKSGDSQGAPEGRLSAYGRNSRKPSAVSTNGRFGFVNSRRTSVQPARTSVNTKTRRNPQYEPNAERSKEMMAKPSWRSSAPKADWE